MTYLTINNSPMFMEKGFNTCAKMLFANAFVHTGNLQIWSLSVKQGGIIIQTTESLKVGELNIIYQFKLYSQSRT